MLIDNQPDRFALFIHDLVHLCLQHQVHLAPSLYQALVVTDLVPGEDPLNFPDVLNALTPPNEGAPKC